MKNVINGYNILTNNEQSILSSNQVNPKILQTFDFAGGGALFSLNENFCKIFEKTNAGYIKNKHYKINTIFKIPKIKDFKIIQIKNGEQDQNKTNRLNNRRVCYV